ncbi:cytochrome aa3 quinol oxidase subunit III [Priestia endophytica]|jgi:cytochrome aa3-600 menaquinol oxidase subunit 3|uniref:Quinol oxidase subunit 3 n=2 Tax=Priestia endophytica TaxID=135735 RepID=A0A329EPI5_9BACI|nr:cytochrome aa3 quinol oxidase subunit III [Priestia endophytica]KAB2491544.1 cytochrome aa3 quinol oxidase subunit III [Priestia endophytica]KYG28622.1 cytochrome o ubiquinol oxidase subunit III [Priestia endophytica]MBG9811929.1 cytochrome o ubiquinol oxidase subunit III [Priestia endophytica]MCM3540382.1 cytochrome aa3 quinol oxidase subunit III [Priestia endophytica]MED4071494.1 cytochrome aa3 quinol oxidase subunit III [Priestia endophytica]
MAAESTHAHDANTPLEYSKGEDRMTILGFWIFLGAEIALFSTLFATYMVLHSRPANGPTSADLFKPEIVLIMTFLLLTSSFTGSMAIHYLRAQKMKAMVTWLLITMALGLGFLGCEIFEFYEYIGHEGVSIKTSAFLSAFFVLVGTHGLHVTIGVGWLTCILIQLKQRGFTPKTARKVFIIGLYWHFLDIVWLFIFTLVYLSGMVL